MQNNLHTLYDTLISVLNSTNRTMFSSPTLLKHLLTEGGFGPNGDFSLGKDIIERVSNRRFSFFKVLLAPILIIVGLNSIASVVGQGFSITFFIGSILGILPAVYLLFKNYYLNIEGIRQDIVSDILSLTSEQRNLLARSYYTVTSEQSESIFTFCKSSKMADEWRQSAMRSRGELYYGDFLIMEALASLDAYFIASNSKNEVESIIRSSDPIFNS